MPGADRRYLAGLCSVAVNRRMEYTDDVEAYHAMLTEVLGPLATTGEALELWTSALVDLSLQQRSLFIYGEVDGQQPPTVDMRNGIAYLEGWDTFADIGAMFIRCAAADGIQGAKRGRLTLARWPFVRGGAALPQLPEHAAASPQPAGLPREQRHRPHLRRDRAPARCELAKREREREPRKAARR